MRPLKARVENGHIVLNEPTSFPEGTVVRLVAVDANDDLDAADRARLHAALDEGIAELDAGKRISSDEVLQRIAKE